MVPVSETRASRRSSESFVDLDPVGQDEEGLETALERSDSVLNHQLDALADLESKAVWTVRLEVVLLGVLASAVRSLPHVLFTPWTLVGAVALVCSILVGTVTYSASRPDVGPGPGSAYSLASAKAEATRWYLELLDGYRVAIDHNEAVIDHNAAYLFRTQLLFASGVSIIAVGMLVST